MITAKRKDGTPVETGDFVLAVWDNGTKQFGRIEEIGKPMRFSNKKFIQLQTYTIRCRDGSNRPAHAWHIKYVKPTRRRKP